MDARLNAFSKGLADIKSQVSALVADAKASIDDNYDDIKAANETTATTARQVSDFVGDLRANVVGGRDVHGIETVGVLPETVKTVSQIQATVAAMQPPLRTLDADLGKFGALLDDTRPRLNANLDALQASQHSVQVILDGPLKTSADNLVVFSLRAGLFADDLHASGQELTETLGYVRDSFKPQHQSFWSGVFTKGVFALLPPAYSMIQPSRVHVTNPVTTINTVPVTPASSKP